MANEDASKDKTVLTIIWEKTKTPLLFLIVFLGAALALSGVQKIKDTFDKAQKAPYVVFEKGPEPTEKSSGLAAANPSTRFVRYAQADILAETIGGKKNELIKDVEELDNETQYPVLSKSISEIQYQNFKTDTELIDALNAVVLRQKDTELKNLDIIFQKSLKDESDTEAEWSRVELGLGILKPRFEIKSEAEIKNLLSAYLNKKAAASLPDDETGRQEIINTIEYYGLSNKLPIIWTNLRRGGEFSFAEFEKQFKEHYSEEKIKQSRLTGKYRGNIENIGGKYQPIFKNIYAALKNEKTLATLFPLQNNGISENRFLSAILDDKNGLSVIYKLFAIILTVVVVFTLLYLILTLLRQIFFLKTATEVIAEQAKKIELKNNSAIAAAASTAANRGAAVTIAAFCIGAAALAANPLVSPINKQGGSAEEEVAQPEKSNLRDPKITNNSPGSEINNESLEILSASISDLKISVDKIKGDFIKLGDNYEGDRPIVLTSPVDTSAITDAISSQTTSIARLSQQMKGELQTVGGFLSGIKSSTDRVPQISDNLSALGSTSDRIFTSASNIEALTKSTIIPGVRELNQKADSLTTTANKIDVATHKIGTMTSSIETTTADTRRNVLGRDGKGFFTQVKTLFTGPRYKVTRGSFAALARVIHNDMIKTQLNKLADDESEMEKAELLALLPRPKEISNKEWKKLQQLILRYTRVARY